MTSFESILRVDSFSTLIPALSNQTFSLLSVVLVVVVIVDSYFKILGSVICLLISAKSAYLQDIEINLSDLL